jgi:hypothetical protein
MGVWCVVGVVILAGLVVVGLLVVALDRARKAIDAMKYDPERL